MLNTPNKNLLALALLCSSLSTVSTYAAEAGPAAAEVKSDGSDAHEGVQHPFFIAKISAATREHTANVDRIATKLDQTDTTRFLSQYSPFAVREVVHEGEIIEYYFESFLTVAMRSLLKGTHDPSLLHPIINLGHWRPHRYEKLLPLYITLCKAPDSFQDIPGRTSLDFAKILVSNQVLSQSLNVPCRLPNGEIETPFGRLIRRFMQYGEIDLLKKVGDKANPNQAHINNMFPLEYIALPARTKKDVIFRNTLNQEYYDLRMKTLAIFLGEMGALNVVTTLHNETKDCYEFANEQIKAALNSGWAQRCANNNITDGVEKFRDSIDKETIATPPITYETGNRPPPGVEVSRTPAA